MLRLTSERSLKALLRFTPSEMTALDIYELREWFDRMTVARAAVPTPATVAPYASLAAAGAMMLRTGADTIAVVDDGFLVGLLPGPRCSRPRWTSPKRQALITLVMER
jgi:hypothetical protein